MSQSDTVLSKWRQARKQKSHPGVFSLMVPTTFLRTSDAMAGGRTNAILSSCQEYTDWETYGLNLNEILTFPREEGRRRLFHLYPRVMRSAAYLLYNRPVE